MAYPWTAGEVVTATDLNAAIAAASTGGSPGGSDGQIQYNDGGAFGGASSLVYDDVNGRVGIGTNSPNRNLHIQQTSSGATAYNLTGGIDIETNNISGLNILSPNNGYGRIYFGSPVSNTAGAVEYIHDATLASGYMKIRAGGADRIYIHGNGNIGVNQFTPSYTLDVNGTGRFTGDLIAGSGFITVNPSSGTEGGEIRLDGGTSYGTSYARIDRYGSNLLRFMDTSAVRMQLDITNGNLTVTGNLTVSGNQIVMAGVATRDKYRMWTSSLYTIGMDSAYTFGALDDYAMTFQMNNDSDRGFWWGDDAHGKNQGAMSLSTDGHLYVANSIKCGYGETNTSNTFAYGIEINGYSRTTVAAGSTLWDQQALQTASSAQGGGLGMRNDGSNNSTTQLRPAGGYLYVRSYNDGTGHIMRAASYQNYSTLRDKQDITDWGATNSVGAAVDPAYSIDATEMVRNLRPVKFRRTKHHRLSADVQNKNERRGRALDRLNNLRRAKGMEDFVSEETVHQCGRDCDGSEENPCKLYRDWEKGEVGFIAEEVINVNPDAVWTDADELPLTIDPMALITMCVKALQEIDNRLAQLEAS